MKSFDDDYLVLAHRGASGYAPENTMAAFERALEIGADGVELDVQLTADGEVVVIHDDKLDRTTNGSGKVAALSLAEIASLDAGSWFSSEYEGERIPLLKDVLLFCRDKMLVNIELKKIKQYEQLVAAVRDIVVKYGALQQVMLTSFDRKTLQEIQNKFPEVRCGVLVDKVKKALFSEGWKYINPRGDAITKEFVALAERSGIKLTAWTINEEAHIEYMLNLGVGHIITNYPDVAIKMIKDRKNS